MTRPASSWLSRICPAFCPAINCRVFYRVPRVPRLFLLKTYHIVFKTLGGLYVCGGYIGKNAGQRWTRDRSITHHLAERWRKDDSYLA